MFCNVMSWKIANVRASPEEEDDDENEDDVEDDDEDDDEDDEGSSENSMGCTPPQSMAT